MTPSVAARRRARPRRAARFALVAALSLAGCGSDGDDGDPASSSSSAAGEPATTTTSAFPATSTTVAGPPVLGIDGIGALRLGMSRAAAEETGMLGPVGASCELSGTTGADLLPPLEGSVDFDADGRLQSVDLRGGSTTAEGVAPTATLAQVRQAYDGRNGFEVERDESTEEVFGIVLVTATKGEAGYTFVFDSGADSASSVAVPRPSFCD